MSQLISNYPIFEGSQVLTSTQLNQLGAYLDQQNRLTRSKLIGMGIVCGLQIKPLSGGLRISKGLGITSEGFLIQIGKDFDGKFYRPYTLPEGVSYKPFGFPEQDIDLFEILSEEPEEDNTVKKLTNPSNFLNDKFVLLFLEIFDQDLKSCLGNSCDDRGQNRLITLRRLLISKSDLEKILPERTSNVSGDFAQALELKDFFIKRPLFSPEGAESKEWKAFIKNYQSPINELLKEDFWENLAKGFEVFSPILGKTFDFSNPFETNSLRQKIKEIGELVAADGKEILGVQYLYDFFKELVTAWTEFLETGRNLWYSCPTDSSLFPLHLMIGRARVQTETAAEFYTFRHGFVQPPVYNGQKAEIERLAQQYRRLILMIETFELSIIREGGKEHPVKITPSKEKYGILGDRSIPYYYDIKSKGKTGSWFSLEKSWPDPERRNTWSPRRGEVLSYDNQPDSPSEKGGFLEAPLHFDLDPYPFFRVEGHLSQSLDEARKRVQQLIQRFNLPIHLHTLHFDEGEGRSLDRCGWHDLQEEYAHQRLLLIGTARDIREVIDYVKNIQAEFNSENLRTAKENIKEDTGKVFLQRVSESLPECLDQLNWEKFQESYKEILDMVLEFLLIKLRLINRLRVTPQTPNIVLQMYNGIIARMSPLIYRLLDLVFFSKIQRLYLSYLNRIQQINQSNLFSDFLKKNPGIEHQAGAYRGGTFILLYHQKSERIIGDFSLPGEICSCEGCFDACENMDWGLLPPFARPDYAVTLANVPILVEPSLNDRLPIERTYEVVLISVLSEQGGEVKQDENKTKFLFNPKKDFSGIDSFEYKLVDKATGKSDTGKVTILVYENAKTCYSADILKCWGEKNVRATLNFREINIPDLYTPDQIIQLLLSSLQETKGFTTLELTQGPLEAIQDKRALLSCLGINSSSESGEKLNRLILNYQQANCGGSENTCISQGIQGTVTDANGKAIRAASIQIKDTDIQTLTDPNGNYSLNFPNPGQTIVVNRIGFISQERFICSEERADFQLVPFRLVAPSDGYVVTLDHLETKEVEKLLDNRKITYEKDSDKEKLIATFLKENPESKLKEEELKVLKKDTLKKVLEDKKIEFGASENKNELINKFKRF
ncbi:carboxypeptidase-like regulatory domain-containing protein [Algoriphagus marincola]|uniref:carboxypeptidase-like regulatory domain-containing protein n=1 Tax=Algoriphagus marincola TaxID=264027 RepID=UPI0003FA6F8E|nr:carboxypeptidase-like regulatory domain-containing protein [Algoriphagus marincola]